MVGNGGDEKWESLFSKNIYFILNSGDLCNQFWCEETERDWRGLRREQRGVREKGDLILCRLSHRYSKGKQILEEKEIMVINFKYCFSIK